jgi:hypothetical protein
MSETKNKSCPFCGWIPKKSDEFMGVWDGEKQIVFMHPSSVVAERCPLNQLMFSKDQWNTRWNEKQFYETAVEIDEVLKYE